MHVYLLCNFWSPPTYPDSSSLYVALQLYRSGTAGVSAVLDQTQTHTPQVPEHERHSAAAIFAESRQSQPACSRLETPRYSQSEPSAWVGLGCGYRQLCDQVSSWHNPSVYKLPALADCLRPRTAWSLWSCIVVGRMLQSSQHISTEGTHMFMLSLLASELLCVVA